MRKLRKAIKKVRGTEKGVRDQKKIGWNPLDLERPLARKNTNSRRIPQPISALIPSPSPCVRSTLERSTDAPPRYLERRRQVNALRSVRTVISCPKARDLDRKSRLNGWWWTSAYRDESQIAPIMRQSSGGVDLKVRWGTSSTSLYLPQWPIKLETKMTIKNH